VLCLGQVLEIGEDGGVKVYDRPAVFTDEGSTPIVTAAPRAPRPARSSAEDHRVIGDAAQAARLSPALVEAVAWQESRMNPGLVSSAGAIGEMQLMPATARALGVDPRDSRQNYGGGAAYLRLLMNRYDGDLIRTLAAYNAGPRAVDRYDGLPPFRETQAYVAAILDRLSRQAAATQGGKR
jgi:soluble lytic murein transglycosylase-like protein